MGGGPDLKDFNKWDDFFKYLSPMVILSLMDLSLKWIAYFTLKKKLSKNTEITRTYQNVNFVAFVLGFVNIGFVLVEYWYGTNVWSELIVQRRPLFTPC